MTSVSLTLGPEVIAHAGSPLGPDTVLQSFNLPDGRRETWLCWLDRTGTDRDVEVLAFTRDKKRVLLVRQWRIAGKNWTIEAPGGTANRGESLRKAAKREFEEETGWLTVPGSLELLGHFPRWSGRSNVLVASFIAECVPGNSPPARDAVEQAAGMEVLLMDPEMLFRVPREELIDPSLGNALWVARAKGLLPS